MLAVARRASTAGTLRRAMPSPLRVAAAPCTGPAGNCVDSETGFSFNDTKRYIDATPLAPRYEAKCAPGLPTPEGGIESGAARFGQVGGVISAFMASNRAALGQNAPLPVVAPD